MKYTLLVGLIAIANAQDAAATAPVATDPAPAPTATVEPAKTETAPATTETAPVTTETAPATTQTAPADVFLLVDPAIHRCQEFVNVLARQRDLDCDPISHRRCRTHQVTVKCK